MIPFIEATQGNLLVGETGSLLDLTGVLFMVRPRVGDTVGTTIVGPAPSGTSGAALVTHALSPGGYNALDFNGSAPLCYGIGVGAISVYSIEVWFTGRTNNAAIISVASDTSSTVYVALGSCNVETQLRVYGTSVANENYGTAPANNAVHHLCVLSDVGGTAFYLDGVRLGFNASPSGIVANYVYLGGFDGKNYNYTECVHAARISNIARYGGPTATSFVVPTLPL